MADVLSVDNLNSLITNQSLESMFIFCKKRIEIQRHTCTISQKRNCDICEIHMCAKIDYNAHNLAMFI